MNTLPIFDVLPELISALNQSHTAILQAAPGAGKTTQVPIALLNEPWLGEQKIIMLEPRRLAARSAAERMASLLNEPVGHTVGYRIKLDTKVSRHTKIEVVTEGILNRMLQTDPALEGVGLVIFDEFHERSLDADLGLALTLQSREYFRDEEQPLKLLVMSATLDSQALCQLLDNPPVICSEGRSYPVDIRYFAPPKTGGYPEPIEKRVVRIIQQALQDEHGSLLVFLPGQGEIRRVESLLADQMPSSSGVIVAPLYGNLNFAEQQRAIAPSSNSQRKIVLATNIAETSLTIEGIRVVIDAGLSRQAIYDPITGMTRLVTKKASRAATDQRAGRAGRLEPGVCYRLWSQDQQQQLSAFTPPEISQADLAPLALQLFQWGCDTPQELQWIDPPNAGRYQQACDLLRQLGALEATTHNTYRLSPYGQHMAQLPMHPRLAHLLITGKSIGALALAADLAALLSERDPLKSNTADIHQRLTWLRANTPESQHLRSSVKQQSQRFQQLITSQERDLTPAENHLTAPMDIAQRASLLVASAWPDRIAKRINNDGTQQVYQLANGRRARFYSPDPLNKSEWLAIAEVIQQETTSGDRITLALALDPLLLAGMLKPLVKHETAVEWSTTNGRLVAEEQTKVGAIILTRNALSQLPDEEVQAAISRWIKASGLEVLPWNATTHAWLARVRFLINSANERSINGFSREEPWPDYSDAGLLASVDSWLIPYLGKVRNQHTLAKIDLLSLLKNQLSWSQLQTIDQLAPNTVSVPSGQSITLDYSETPPVLAVKLQSMFGCTSTPVVCGAPVKLHLLSPAGRPLQVTQDLAHFWKHVYPEVKKEMKGRYPKHPWPDDPLTAVATHQTKRAMGSSQSS
ncbi:ATP-dependent helicase HrpB [Neptunomonas sp. CHC150]|uniref:ATP-dependent helicase HrpB n=1 Tax=Neptunomonas sp. CHC150 TaxID=2998324 RepID=UPI0025B06613|nr:ATP-dependent helicase HrpB [Neptunomonas sp. CHC150]MDN2659579.1 ATP-dependent helicase HrpB [Neptunomonas sp. CHC150]